MLALYLVKQIRLLSSSIKLWGNFLILLNCHPVRLPARVGAASEGAATAEAGRVRGLRAAVLRHQGPGRAPGHVPTDPHRHPAHVARDWAVPTAVCSGMAKCRTSHCGRWIPKSIQSASIAWSQGLLESFCGSSLGLWAILQMLCCQTRRKLPEELAQKLASKPCD